MGQLRASRALRVAAAGARGARLRVASAAVGPAAAVEVVVVAGVAYPRAAAGALAGPAEAAERDADRAVRPKRGFLDARCEHRTGVRVWLPRRASSFGRSVEASCGLATPAEECLWLPR